MTQTMRERLASIAEREADVVTQDGPHVDNWPQVIDAVLAELQTYVPPPETVVWTHASHHGEPESNVCADEVDAQIMAAMIKHIRRGEPKI